jgi:PAS domain S-box-containing protein
MRMAAFDGGDADGNEPMHAEMLRYVRFGDEDAEALALLHRYGQDRFDHIATVFYERTREHEGAHEVLRDEAQVERLHRSLVRWLHRFCTGARDEAYYAETAKVGRVHVQVGLPQRYVFTAMAVLRGELDLIIDEKVPDKKRPAVRRALAKALHVEIGVMLQTYHDDVIDRIRRFDRMEADMRGRALASSERRYVHAVDLASFMLVGLDSGGSVRLFNREAERVTGFARDEALGRSFVDLLLAETARQTAEAIDRELGGRGRGHETLRADLLTRAGKIRKVSLQLVRVDDLDPGDVALFVYAYDITDEIAMGERVRQSEKLAAVGTLAAGLAHEIRNPLNGAQLHVTFLERSLKKAGIHQEDVLEAVRVVDDEIKRLSQLVNEFLDFARPRPLDLRAHSLRALCERTVQLVGPQATATHTSLTLQLPVTDLTLEIDGAKIEQVLLNLLQNAIEAVGPMGGGHVVLRARRKPHELVLEVEDDGPGLADAAAPIFDAFFSTKPQGTGLGLAIVHRIVTDHGGSISVESRQPPTIFRIALPLTHPS